MQVFPVGSEDRPQVDQEIDDRVAVLVVAVDHKAVALFLLRREEDHATITISSLRMSVDRVGGSGSEAGKAINGNGCAGRFVGGHYSSPSCALSTARCSPSQKA